MNLHRALERLGKLTLAQLNHARGLRVVEITNYERAIANYPPDRMRKYGAPFMVKLKDGLAKIDAEIAKRGEQG